MRERTHGINETDSDSENGLMFVWGKDEGEEIVRGFGMDMNTLPYLKWITNKDLSYSTWNSPQYYMASWMGGEFGGEGIHVHVWLSPFAVHLKLSQHCSSAIHQYKIKSFTKQRIC